MIKLIDWVLLVVGFFFFVFGALQWPTALCRVYAICTPNVVLYFPFIFNVAPVQIVCNVTERLIGPSNRGTMNRGQGS